MKRLLIFLLLFTVVSGWAQTRVIIINGTFSGWKGSDSIAIYAVSKKSVSDTVVAKNGRFSVILNSPEPLNISISRLSTKKGGRRDNCSFFAGKGVIEVRGTDSLATAVVSGSKLNEEYKVMEQMLDPVIKRLVALKLKAIRIPVEERKTEQFRQMEKEYSLLQDTIEQRRIVFIKGHPNSFISLVALKAVAGTPVNYNKAWPLYQSLSGDLKALPSGRELDADLRLAARTNIGAVLPGFTSLDTLRKPVSLEDIVKKGKVTLVDFWASWCTPCRKENPNVVKVYNVFHEKGFNILSVSLDRSEVAWKKAIATDGMPWYHVSSLKFWDEPVVKLYGIQAVPDNFLLDENGKVIARGLRGEALYKKIEEALN